MATKLSFTQDETKAVEDYRKKGGNNPIRFIRNMRLAESDWTQVADAPVDRAAWATYRQALRDLPAQTGDIKQWPVKPEGNTPLPADPV